jgi:hypothetical protein
MQYKKVFFFPDLRRKLVNSSCRQNMLHLKLKVTVKFTLEQATKALRGKRYSSTPPLTSLLAPCPGRFTPENTQVPIV